MKHNIQMSPSIASEELDKSIMGLAVESSDMFSYFLRDKIYSDKMLACIREYICNAMDEHVKHNIDRPIEVSINNVDGEDVWSVRDYAAGLNEHNIRNVFGMYGRSTKTTSNELVGCYGIGSKSAHCYTDTFYVKSHFEGTCTLYACVLGGGSKGVPVGELYKISEEPTSESGIEVSFIIKQFDKQAFTAKTRIFVASFGKPGAIVFKHGQITITPAAPDHTLEHSGFTFNVYHHVSFNELDFAMMHLRMGGVIYKKVNLPERSNGIIIVDVPIGKLTIPISREYIEQTPANDIVLANINTAIKSILDDELASVPKITMAEYVTMANHNDLMPIKWFKHRSHSVYPNESKLRWQFKNHHFSYGKTPTLTSDGKLKVYVVHAVRSGTRNQWLQRMHAHLNNQDGYVIMDEASKTNYFDANPMPIEVDMSNIEFLDIRKIGIPALKKAPADPNKVTRYVAYKDFQRIDAFTAEEFETYVAKKTNTPFVKDWLKSATTFEDLKKRTISTSNSSGWDGYYVKSNAMHKQLLELGWVDRFSVDYRTQHDKIVKLEYERKKADQAAYTLRNLFKTTINEKAINRLKNDPTSIDRFNKLSSKIKLEDSIRARILNAVNSNYHILSRAEYRVILKLTTP